jgi:transcriptional regulator with XRE-family HTH domain
LLSSNSYEEIAKRKGLKMSNREEEYTIEELFKRLPISVSELARRSKISEVTAAAIRNGKTARLHTINKLLATFSELYGVTLTVDNVKGLRILVGRYGERERASEKTEEARQPLPNGGNIRYKVNHQLVPALVS